MSEEPHDLKDENPARPDQGGVWIAVGAGAGTALGVAIDNIAIGLALGVALGAIIGVLMNRRAQ